MSLQGRTVVVTRDEAAGGALSRALEARGAGILHVPLVHAVPAADGRPLAAALAELGASDWILLTSARAVAALPSPELPARVAAVGPATAAAWEDRSGRPAHLTGDGGAARLAALVAAEPGIPGARVVWPASDRADRAALEPLEAAGAVTTVVTVYRVEARADGEAELARILEDTPPDAVALASPSAVEGLVRALAGLTTPPPVLAAVGGTTARAVRAAGLPEPVVPDQPGFEALAGALADRFARTP